MATKTKARPNKNPAPEALSVPAAIPGTVSTPAAAAAGVDELTAMLLGTGAVAQTEVKKSKSKTPVVRLESILKPQVAKVTDPKTGKVSEQEVPESSIQDRYIKATKAMKDATASQKDLGGLIKADAGKALVNYCRETKSYHVSVSLNGRLTFVGGRYEPVPPSKDNPQNPSYVAQVAALCKLFGAEKFQQYFGTESTLQIKSSILESGQAKVVVSKLKELVGAENFANWFSFEPTIFTKREGDDQVLQRDATMDPEARAKADLAIAQGLVKQYDGTVK